jgi:ADP-ribose pyrophosphatase YjhB (NUDIX family)
MSNSEDSLTSSIILCHYGNANGVFLVGGLVDIDETPIEAGIRYCREMINFVQRSDMLSLFNVIDGIKDLVQIRISMYILDVKFGSLDMTYITRYGAV